MTTVYMTESNGTRSSSAKSTSSAYSHSSRMPRIDIGGSGLVVFCLTATRAAATRTSRGSSSLQPAKCRTYSILRRCIVSNARDMSMPIFCKSQ